MSHRKAGLAARASAVLATLCAFPTPAATIDLVGSGSVAPTGAPDAAGNVPLFASGAYAFDGVGGWTLASPFNFNLAAGTGEGAFAFANGADSLVGSLTSSWLLGPSGPIGFELRYSISGGTGAYAGARGRGASTVLLLGDPNLPPTPFTEMGRLHVPSPGTLWLLGFGLAAILCSASWPISRAHPVRRSPR